MSPGIIWSLAQSAYCRRFIPTCHVMPDGGALSEVYQDPTEIERRRDGVRYHAALEDGTPVVVQAFLSDVSRQLSSIDGLVSAFEQTAAVHHESLVPALAWGQLRDGTVHCAYARFDVEALKPGVTASMQVARIGAEVARGLAAAHGAGLVHGAITPRAVVVARERGAMLGDLGLFAALRSGGLDLHHAVTLLSDERYVAPDVLRGGTPDQSSDVYSLGASLYDVLASTVGAGVAQPVADVLQRAVDATPENRWPSAAAFAQALAAAVAEPRSSASTDLHTRRGCLSAAVGKAAVTAFVVYFVGVVSAGRSRGNSRKVRAPRASRQVTPGNGDREVAATDSLTENNRRWPARDQARVKR
jgi:hypothetical protein